MLREQPAKDPIGLGRLVGVDEAPSPLGEQRIRLRAGRFQRFFRMKIAEEPLELAGRLAVAPGLAQQSCPGQPRPRGLLRFRVLIDNQRISLQRGLRLTTRFQSVGPGQRDLGAIGSAGASSITWAYAWAASAGLFSSESPPQSRVRSNPKRRRCRVAPPARLVLRLLLPAFGGSATSRNCSAARSA